MRILILGGDGYLGWPTAMYFSKRGHDVTVVDNYFRRNACTELDVGMLYPVPTLVERAKIWHAKTGLEIKVVIGDLTDPGSRCGRFSTVRVHYYLGHKPGLSLVFRRP
jgi:UDP-sulfoquinovose synthase